MALGDFQQLLARLYTDPAFRESCLDPFQRPQLLSRLSPPEAAAMSEWLNSPAYQELAFFADTLVQKRLEGVRKILPRTAQVLGPGFRKAFHAFACMNAIPGDIHAHQADAANFLEFCIAPNHLAASRSEKSEPVWGVSTALLATVARYERARLDVMQGAAQVSLYWNFSFFKHKAVAPPLPLDILKPALVFWFRWGQSSRLHQWRLGFPKPLIPK